VLFLVARLDFIWTRLFTVPSMLHSMTIGSEAEYNTVNILYVCCSLISRFWNVEILLKFNLAFPQCSTSVYQAFDGQTEFLGVFIIFAKFVKI